MITLISRKASREYQNQYTESLGFLSIIYVVIVHAYPTIEKMFYFMFWSPWNMKNCRMEYELEVYYVIVQQSCSLRSNYDNKVMQLSLKKLSKFMLHRSNSNSPCRLYCQ